MYKMESLFQRHHALLLSRCVLVGTIVLSLVSCDFLFNGSFPADLGQASARADLSSKISTTLAKSFSLSILKSGTTEQVLLYSTLAADNSHAHILSLTPTLEVQSSFTLDDVTALAPAGVPFKGSSAVTHLLDGHFIIGNVEAVVGSNSLAPLRKLEPNPVPPPVSAEMNNWTIVGPANAAFTWTDFYVDSATNLLHYTAYAGDWSTNISISHPVGRSYRLEGVFTDPEDATSNLAVLVFRDGPSSTDYFLQVPKNPDMMNGFPGPALFDNTAYTSFSVPDLAEGSVMATVDGIIAYNQNTQCWVRFTPSSPGTVSSLHVRNRKFDAQTAFSFSGGYYCIWDPDTEVLTRYEKWW
jgi:hypothetical protein